MSSAVVDLALWVDDLAGATAWVAGWWPEHFAKMAAIGPSGRLRCLGMRKLRFVAWSEEADES